MDFNIDTWIKKYTEKLRVLFGIRLLFIGLQGSYARGEATDESDIDAVVILDRAESADLKAYGSMLDTLTDRERVCGFISGRQELLNWEPSDLFQFYHDTCPIYGSIDFLLPLIGKTDIRRAIRIGACNIYHMCGHNIVHEKNTEILKSLYKSAGFTIQAIHYGKTENYIRQQAKLVPLLEEKERAILLAGIDLRSKQDVSNESFDYLSDLLFIWAAGLIIEYGTTSYMPG